MKYRVIRKQENSKMCMICGLENEFGLNASFYELENNDLAAIFTPKEEHQSYPGIVHGGMISAILDETIGRSFLIKNADVWGVTMEIKINYLKPIPLSRMTKALGRITGEDDKIFEGTGEILLSNGDVAARGYAKYLKLPIWKTDGADFQAIGWEVTASETDPMEFEY